MNLQKKKLTLQYCILQGAYWASFGTIYAFATLFLLDRGFESSAIGVIIALGNILGVILQPVFAAVADSSRTITLHKLTGALSCLMLLLLALLYLTPNGLLAVAVLFLLTDTFLQVIQPLINSISVYYVNRGVEVDFGSARGTGSLSYAVVTYALGSFVERYGTSSILLTGLLLVLIISATVLTMPVLPAVRAAHPAEDSSGKAGQEDHRAEPLSSPDAAHAAGSESMFSFIGRYKYFMLTLVGITFLFTFHNMNNSYLIHIITNVGGSSSDLGKALAVAAVTELPVMFLFSRLARRFPSSTLLMVSGVVFALKAAICMLASHMTLLYASQLLQMGSFALYMPASVYYVNHTMDDRDKFKGQAVMTGTNTLGGVFGSLLGGFLIDSAGVPAMNAAGFGLAACGCVLVLLFAGKRDQG